MGKNRSIFYKERDWDDFHFYNGSILPDIKVVQPPSQYYFRGSKGTIYHTDYYDRILPAQERNDGLKFRHDIIFNAKLGTLRGLSEDDVSYKLMTCIKGSVYLVVVDTRKHSTNFGKWEHFVVSPQTQTQILIPPYFAFGYYVMDDDSIVLQKMAYMEGINIGEHTQNFDHNDRRFNIKWPVSHPIVDNVGII
jgi:dTDP-4-dehydrorhamnose 3,5-epimerase